MPSVTEAALPIADEEGRVAGQLVIRLLAKSHNASPPALLDLRQSSDRDKSLEPVQLLEGTEYLYTFDFEGDSSISTDRTELFDPETTDGRRGRLRPGQSVGTVPCTIEIDGRRVGHVAFEVRSRKLDYRSQYRWMLRDIAESAVEAILERFAPTEQRFTIGEEKPARTLYHAFAFLAAMLESNEFEAAIHHVLYRPFVTWEPSSEVHRPGQGLPPSSQLIRQLARPGPRVFTPRGRPFKHLPERLHVSRQESTIDNLPNRFVKYALIQWRDFVLRVRDALAQEQETGPVARGLRETEAVQEALEGYLVNPAFADIGTLDQIPWGSQVLQKRQGYREIFHAYIQFETASQLTWEGGDDVFSAGQRDVATLYEYWIFFQLLHVFSELCDRKVDASSLLSSTQSGLTLSLKRGREMALQGEVERLGRQLKIGLLFNKTFSPLSRDGSWSRVMRLDCSITIDLVERGRTFQPVWLHFDAKYRVDFIEELFGPDASTAADEDEVIADEDQAERAGTSKRSDLLKMHAYRDAIRRTAGAYVLYPGTRNEASPEYHELLPGIGAFGLKPQEIGQSQGLDKLRVFLEDVLIHVASQTSQHERGRYWKRESFESTKGLGLTTQSAPFLTKPPADTNVLLGFVRSASQLDWIHRTNLYNLRGDTERRGSVGLDSKELAADLLLLYGTFTDSVELWAVSGDPLLMTADELRSDGYPSPSGRLYYCLPIQAIDLTSWVDEILPEDVDRAIRAIDRKPAFGAPVAITWLHLNEARQLRQSD